MSDPTQAEIMAAHDNHNVLQLDIWAARQLGWKVQDGSQVGVPPHSHGFSPLPCFTTSHDAAADVEWVAMPEGYYINEIGCDNHMELCKHGKLADIVNVSYMESTRPATRTALVLVAVAVEAANG